MVVDRLTHIDRSAQAQNERALYLFRRAALSSRQKRSARKPNRPFPKKCAGRIPDSVL